MGASKAKVIVSAKNDIKANERRHRAQPESSDKGARVAAVRGVVTAGKDNRTQGSTINKKNTIGKRTSTTTTSSGGGNFATAATPLLKRKRDAEEEVTVTPSKEAGTSTKGPVLQEPPSQRLNVYVFGTGDGCELGLGSGKKTGIVRRPRLNPFLLPDKVGVVQVAAGGMHCVALTADGKILTWGVNDEGALGRNTAWTPVWKEISAEGGSDSENEDEDDGFNLNPKESTPAEVDWSTTTLAEGTRFVQVTAGDSASFALTDDGLVYGWGTFRDNAGDKTFTPCAERAFRPVLIPGLRRIVQVKAGANHAIALSSAGIVYAWGSYEQGQLGRRILEHKKYRALVPTELGLPKGPKNHIVSIETGSYHGFALSKDGKVYSWGLNNFGETGVTDNAGQDSAVVVPAQVVKSLRGKNIVSIKGGTHHSLAATADGSCLAWGRIDGNLMGIPEGELAELPDAVFVKDEQNRRRILIRPHTVPIGGVAISVATSSDHNIVVTRDGKAWSWGFSSGYQTGQGTTDDIVVATIIDNTAVRHMTLTSAATGGQFSILTALAEEGNSIANSL